ncbi:hypothetical protein EhV059 [Emiliania huxleyi virus 86]|uniref:Putative membrane protein n=2 Tax=Emiliania huxleyi virus 86 TaxID=181082 RepID=Q4A374_EHV8U|nr:hypothetical protein EhV059 [Emiliania huxleyi virus 86]AEO97871.1 hypothetical protein ENVG_00175 [Emiliania huxleyi virus 84]AEP14998.1 hypothetical protein EOVG_00061 [Emiliania huxleyi virus 88]AHA55662.1 putative membrane protein [Emiliania huxleyi virus 164]CAI65482.1 putative membrane protein [Emiliania huxleyi virus 86]
MKATSIVSITFSVLFVLLCVYEFIWSRRYGPKNMHIIRDKNTRIIIPDVSIDQLIDGTPTGSTTKWIPPMDSIRGKNTRILIPGISIDQLIDGTLTGSTTQWISSADEIASRDIARQLSIIREKNGSSTLRENPFLG